MFLMRRLISTRKRLFLYSSIICNNLTPNDLHKRCSSTSYMDYSIPNDPSFLLKQHAVSSNKQNLVLHWQQDSNPNSFHALWLRHQCHCEECLQHSSGQRLLNPENIEIPVFIQEAKVREGSVDLNWSFGNDGLHQGNVPLQWLHLNRESYFEGQREEAFRLDVFDFKDVVNSEEGLYEYLYGINQNGVVKLVNTPENGGVTKLAEAISYILETAYGVTFNVVVKPNPDNAAYDSVALLHHADLLYYRNCPGLQHLHCVRKDRSVTGGILTLKDAYHVAEDFRQQHPEHFNALATIPMQFNNLQFSRGAYLITDCTHIKLDKNGQIEEIKWAPNFQGPVKSQDPNELEAYFSAFKKFNEFVENYPNLVAFDYKEGDVISFHNTRMVHGRTQIELNGGERVLVGAYSPLDEFRSRLRYLSVKLGKTIPKKIW